MEAEILRLRAEAAEHRRVAATLRSSHLFTVNVPHPPVVMTQPSDQGTNTQTMHSVENAKRDSKPVAPRPPPSSMPTGFKGMEEREISAKVKQSLLEERRKHDGQSAVLRLQQLLEKHEAAVARLDLQQNEGGDSDEAVDGMGSAPRSTYYFSDSLARHRSVGCGSGESVSGRQADIKTFQSKLKEAREEGKRQLHATTVAHREVDSVDPTSPTVIPSVLWQPPDLNDYITQLEDRVASAQQYRRQMLQQVSPPRQQHTSNLMMPPTLPKQSLDLTDVLPGMTARTEAIQRRREAAVARKQEQLKLEAEQRAAAIAELEQQREQLKQQQEQQRGSSVDARERAQTRQRSQSPARLHQRPTVTIDHNTAATTSTTATTRRRSVSSSHSNVSNEAKHERRYKPPPTPPHVKSMQDRAAKQKEARLEREKRRAEALAAAKAAAEEEERARLEAEKQAKREAILAKKTAVALKLAEEAAIASARSHYRELLVRRAWRCWVGMVTSRAQMDDAARHHYQGQVKQTVLDAWVLLCAFYKHQRASLGCVLALQCLRHYCKRWYHMTRQRKAARTMIRVTRQHQLGRGFVLWRRFTVQVREWKKRLLEEAIKAEREARKALEDAMAAELYDRRRLLGMAWCGWMAAMSELRAEKARERWEQSKLNEVLSWLGPL